MINDYEVEVKHLFEITCTNELFIITPEMYNKTINGQFRFFMT